MHILAIETSCDETAISVARVLRGNVVILASVVSSQARLHARWGGVVPNLAAREHLKNFLPVLDLALHKAGLVTPRQIDLIAVTQGPGLIPALMIGTDAAKTLSYLWKKPLLGIHHIEGHIYANFIPDKNSVSSKLQAPISRQNPEIKFPILCLVVSGGHTQLVLMRDHLHYEIIGQTLDDAVGEAFDKVARILGLGYPGGPAIAAAAAKFPISNLQFPNNFQNSKFKIQNSITLPRPMLNKDNFNFSFSGLKTAVLYAVKNYQGSTLKNKKVGPWKNYVTAMCHEFQQAAIDVLVSKTLKAAQKYNPHTIMLAGGVSANQELRCQMGESIKKELENTLYIIPDTTYSIDNAAMIAVAGYYRWQNMTDSQKQQASCAWKSLQANANLKLE